MLAGKVRFGVIGCGNIANLFHLPELKSIEEVEVVGVADVRPERAKSTAEKFRVPYWYTDYRKLLERGDVDAVVVATPHPYHASIAVDAIESGKHVIIQKPMATTVEDAGKIVSAAKRCKNVKVMVLPFIYFDTPTFDYIRGVVSDGELGKICMARARVAHSGPGIPWFLRRETAQRGVAFDLGVYSVAALNLILGRFRKVSGFMATLAAETDLEDSVAILLEAKDGVIGVAEAAWTQAAAFNEFSIYGTEGIVLMESGIGGERVRLYRRRELSWVSPVLPREKEPQHSHRHFVRCILEDRTPIGTPEQGYHLIEVLDAACRSAVEGRTIYL